MGSSTVCSQHKKKCTKEMDGHNQTITRQLVNPAKLYDRDHQTILLTEAYSRCCRQQERPSLNQREMVFISGPSGGKG